MKTLQKTYEVIQMLEIRNDKLYIQNVEIGDEYSLLQILDKSQKWDDFQKDLKLFLTGGIL